MDKIQLTRAQKAARRRRRKARRAEQTKKWIASLVARGFHKKPVKERILPWLRR